MLTSILTSLFAVTSVLALPSLHDFPPRAPPAIPDTNTTVYSDAQILQLALYIENLENAFL